MKIQVSDFFKPVNLYAPPTEKEYEAIRPYINAAKIFAQSTYQSIYIIDYYIKGFLYVSDNPLFLCGNTPSAVKNMGYLFYLNNVPKQDLDLLLEINTAGFSFYNSTPIEERLQYSISYDFHIIQPNKHLLLINHKLTPMVLDKLSNVWLAFCVVSVASNDKAGNISFRKVGSNKIIQYDIENKNWELQPSPKLTRIEKEILMLSVQGITMKGISIKMHLTEATIKFHRSKILNKLNVKNITEAIASASNYKLI